MEDFITAFPVSGDNKVEKISYEKNKVWINPICEKWLKDRKDRVLSGEEINHYQRVVVSLKETIRLMREIDKSIPKWPME